MNQRILLQELLTVRDELIGQRAEDAERRARYLLLKQDCQDLRKKLEEQTVLLRENMTRAYEAESRVLEIETKIEQIRLECAANIARFESSRSWRAARALSSPVRLIRHLARS
jgi:hypothetical protein